MADLSLPKQYFRVLSLSISCPMHSYHRVSKRYVPGAEIYFTLESLLTSNLWLGKESANRPQSWSRPALKRGTKSMALVQDSMEPSTTSIRVRYRMRTALVTLSYILVLRACSTQFKVRTRRMRTTTKTAISAGRRNLAGFSGWKERWPAGRISMSLRPGSLTEEAGIHLWSLDNKTFAHFARSIRVINEVLRNKEQNRRQTLSVAGLPKDT